MQRKLLQAQTVILWKKKKNPSGELLYLLFNFQQKVGACNLKIST